MRTRIPNNPLHGTARPASALVGATSAPLIGLMVLGLTTAAGAQSSSLYVEGDRSQPPRRSTQQRSTQQAGPGGRAGAAGPNAPAARGRQQRAWTGQQAANGSRRAGQRPRTGPTQGNAANQRRMANRRRTAARQNAPAPRPERRRMQRVNGRLINPHLQSSSYMAVVPPEPREFEPQDLITVIIREEASASSEASLDTEKETTIEGEVGDFPRLRLKQLLQGVVTSSRQEDLPAVDVSGSNEFEGDGEYERSDSMVTRLTARVVDVKPNGTLTLEARTQLNNDDESMVIKVTGTCRTEDITPDNTILSTEMYDLRVDKQHEGELRDSSAKGLFTNILETLFNF